MVTRVFLYLPFLGIVAVYSPIGYGIATVSGLDDFLEIGLYSPMAALFLIILLVYCVVLMAYLTLRAVLEQSP